MHVRLFILLLLLPVISIAANETDLAKLIELKKTQTTVHLDLSNADLRQYTFTPGKIDLQQANLSHTNLSGAILSKMNLGGADLSHADLSNAKLVQVNLAGANLSHANLTGAELQQSDLTGADLSFAQLTNANLQQSILAKTNLMCANLNQANLNRANMSSSDISGATFVNTSTVEISGYESVVDAKVGC
jgi:uncharacterized protein YjbI with pentapeptide repeats